MSRLFVLLLLGAMAVTGSSCGGDSADPEPPSPPTTTTTPGPEPPPPQQRGVVLRLDRDTASPGQTPELTIVNRTEHRLEYGVAYRLELRTDDGWRWVNRDSAFVLILKTLEPGGRDREEIALPGDLRRGRYRIVKSFTVATSRREIRADVEFFVP